MGKYVEKHLYENEWIVEKASRDPWQLVWWWVFGILCCWALLIPLILAIKKTVVYCKTEFVLTNKRIIYKWGVFHVRALGIPLQKVESITADTTFWGRIFNVGIVRITSPQGKIKEKIEYADDFKTAVLGQIEQLDIVTPNNDKMVMRAVMPEMRKDPFDPYAGYGRDVHTGKEEPFDPYAGYGRNPYTGKRD